MNNVEQLIVSLFYGDYCTLFEVVDSDGIRKPVLEASKQKDDGETETWRVTINRRLLKKWEVKNET